MSLSMYILLQNKEFCSILCIFGKTWLYIVLHDFNLTYYSSIILGSSSILLAIPKIMLAYWPHPYTQGGAVSEPSRDVRHLIKLEQQSFSSP